jgi:hypothetical protein
MLRCVAILFVLAAPRLVIAQADSGARRDYRVCWRGKPLPQCDSFWLTEISGEYAYASTQTHYSLGSGSNTYSYSQRDVSSQLLWTVGPMFNTSAARALGGTLSVGFVNEGSRIAVEARRRYWTSPGNAVDFSVGAIRMNAPPLPAQSGQAPYGATAGAYVVGGDLIHVNAHADVLLTGGRMRAGGTVGAGFGGYAAIGATVVAGALVVVALIAFLRSGDF